MATAWVPDDDLERDWSVAAGLAAQWVDGRAREEGAAAVLVTNALDWLGVPELDEFGSRHIRTSLRADRRRVGPGRGPVLSYVPGPEQLAFAMTLGQNSSVAVVEGNAFSVQGWAAWLGATNLLTGERQRPLPGHVREIVERLAFHSRNNFADPSGKREAQRALSSLGGSKELEIAAGALLARGSRAKAVKKLLAFVG